MRHSVFFLLVVMLVAACGVGSAATSSSTSNASPTRAAQRPSPTSDLPSGYRWIVRSNLGISFVVPLDWEYDEPPAQLPVEILRFSPLNVTGEMLAFLLQTGNRTSRTPSSPKSVLQSLMSTQEWARMEKSKTYRVVRDFWTTKTGTGQEAACYQYHHTDDGGRALSTRIAVVMGKDRVYTFQWAGSVDLESTIDRIAETMLASTRIGVR